MNRVEITGTVEGAVKRRESRGIEHGTAVVVVETTLEVDGSKRTWHTKVFVRALGAAAKALDDLGFSGDELRIRGIVATNTESKAIEVITGDVTRASDAAPGAIGGGAEGQGSPEAAPRAAGSAVEAHRAKKRAMRPAKPRKAKEAV